MDRTLRMNYTGKKARLRRSEDDYDSSNDME